MNSSTVEAQQKAHEEFFIRMSGMSDQEAEQARFRQLKFREMLDLSEEERFELNNLNQKYSLDENGGVALNEIAPQYADPLQTATQHSGRFPLDSGPSNGVLFRLRSDGQVTSYATYDEEGMILKRVDVVGKAHNGVETPHVVEYGRNSYDKDGKMIHRVQSPSTKSKPRPARPEEIPSSR